LERLRSLLSERCAGAGHFALLKRGDQVTPVSDAAISLMDGIASFDQSFTSARHRLAHLFAEAGW
jgi:hypothetical protein